jgi:hypothetical protein
VSDADIDIHAARHLSVRGAIFGNAVAAPVSATTCPEHQTCLPEPCKIRQISLNYHVANYVLYHWGFPNIGPSSTHAFLSFFVPILATRSGK